MEVVTALKGEKHGTGKEEEEEEAAAVGERALPTMNAPEDGGEDEVEEEGVEEGEKACSRVA